MQVNPGAVAVALSQAVQLAGTMQWCLRQTAEIENNMTAMERVLEYCDLEPEPPRL